MRRLMDMALDDMVREGIDLSVLGGRRQRYNYFSFEKTGSLYEFTINDDNLRHCFSADRAAYHTVKLTKLNENDTGALRNIKKLLEGRGIILCPQSGYTTSSARRHTICSHKGRRICGVFDL